MLAIACVTSNRMRSSAESPVTVARSGSIAASAFPLGMQGERLRLVERLAQAAILCDQHLPATAPEGSIVTMTAAHP